MTTSIDGVNNTFVNLTPVLGPGEHAGVHVQIGFVDELGGRRVDRNFAVLTSSDARITGAALIAYADMLDRTSS